MKASVWTAARKATLLSTFLWLCICHYFAFFFFFLVRGKRFAAPRLNPASCLFATSVSVPARPVNRVLATKHSGRAFLGRLQLKPQLVDTS